MTTTSDRIFSDEVIREFKFRKVVKTIGKDVLHACVQSCCTDTFAEISQKIKDKKLEIKNPNPKKGDRNLGKKNPNPKKVDQNLEKKNTAKNSEEGKSKKGNQTNDGKEMIKVIMNSYEISAAQDDPTGKSFDITLLFKILSLIEADYITLYSKLRDVKDLRNNVCHDELPLDKSAFDDKVTKFQTLIEDILKEAEVTSEKVLKSRESQESRDPDTESEISDGFSRIKTLQSELSQRIDGIKKETIQESRTDILEFLKKEGHEEIRSDYTKYLYNMNPVEFFIETEVSCSVSEFYAELEFSDIHDSSNVPQKDVIQMAVDGTSNVIIEGIAGVGKTSLIRKIMAVVKKNPTNKSPLIHFDCRISDYSNLTEFLSSIMPNSWSIFSNENIKSAILTLKPVFLVDGVDELNENSDKIFNEIAEIVKRNHAKIFATTRPEGVTKFLSRIPSSNFKHLEVRGILEEKQEEIIQNYMRIFSPHFHTTSRPSFEEINKKLSEVREYLKEYLKVPLIICLLVYFILDSKSSLSEIYTAITNALRDKLKSRLRSSLSRDQIDERVDKFSSNIYEVSFNLLEMRGIILEPRNSSEIGEETGQIFGDLKEAAMSSFFLCRGSLTTTGHKITYSFPHKSFQEYYAANQIEKMLKNENEKVKIWKRVDLQNLRNIRLLLFLIGSMERNSSLTREVCGYIVRELAKKKRLFSRQTASGSLTKFRIQPTSLFYDILRESKDHHLMIESLSETLEELTLDQSQDRLVPFPRIFEEKCPRMASVDLSFALRSNELSPSIEKILSSLKMKNIEMELKFVTNGKTTNHHCDDYIRVLHGGSSRIKSFEGCLGEVGIRHLPNVLREIHIYIGSPREASGLRSLNEHGRMSIKRLKLTVPRKLRSELLSVRLSTRGVDTFQLIVRDIRSPDDLDWVYDVARRILPMRDTDGRSDRCWLSIHCTPMYKELKKLVGKLREGGLWLTTLTIDCEPPLKKMQVEEMEVLCKEELSCGFRSPNSTKNVFASHSERTIRELPIEVEELSLWIRHEEDLRTLECLIKRMRMAQKNADGGRNSIGGIRLDRLELKISPKCDADEMPMKFPIPSWELLVQIFDANFDISWTLEVMDKLPRISDSKCEDICVCFEAYSINEDSAIQFLEELKGKAFQELRKGMAFQKMRIYFRFKFDPKHESTLKSLKEAGILVR